VKRAFFLLNAAFAMAILALISRAHRASFVIMLPKQLNSSTFSTGFFIYLNCNGVGCLEILIVLVFTLISNFS
jgi:hypothetical protein